MAIAIVDGLEHVDVREREDEPSVRAPRPVDLVGQRKLTHLPAVGAGQPVEVGRVEFCLQACPFGGRRRPVECRSFPIGSGPYPIRRRDRAESLELLHERRLGCRHWQAEFRGTCVAGPGRLVARVRDPVTIRRGQVPVAGRAFPVEAVGQALDRTTDPLIAGDVIGRLIGRIDVRTARLFTIRGGLVIVRRALIAIRACLVGGRCGLIGVRGRLIGVGGGLIGIGGTLLATQRATRSDDVREL